MGPLTTSSPDFYQALPALGHRVATAALSVPPEFQAIKREALSRIQNEDSELTRLELARDLLLLLVTHAQNADEFCQVTDAVGRLNTQIRGLYPPLPDL